MCVSHRYHCPSRQQRWLESQVKHHVELSVLSLSTLSSICALLALSQCFCSTRDPTLAVSHSHSSLFLSYFLSSIPTSLICSPPRFIMAFFRPFLSDPFFSSPSASLFSPSSSLLFDDEPLFSSTPLHLYDNTPTPRRGGGRRATGNNGQQQLKEQQAGSGNNAQLLVSDAGSGGEDSAATATTSLNNKQTAVADNKSNSNNNKSSASGAVSIRGRQPARLLSPLSLMAPFNSATSLLSPRAVLPSMSVDLLSSDVEYTVHASVPGVAKQDLKVTVEDGVLTIEAERRGETRHSRGTNSSSSNGSQQQQSTGSPSSTTTTTEDNKHEQKAATPAASTDSAPMESDDNDSWPQYHHMESFYGHISRSITLPDDCHTDGMSAKYEDGVLKIHIPRLQDKRQRSTRLEIL